MPSSIRNSLGALTAIYRLIIFFGLAVSLQAVDSPDWLLVWADEFNIDGLPNPDNWSYEEGYLRNDEAQYYTRERSENARVENGNLIIEARHDFWPQGEAIREYTSASLITRETAGWIYGRIEVRAKIPTGIGMWPAIWTLGTNIGDVGWPKCGEIDILENVGFDPLKIHANIHTESYNHVAGTGRGTYYTAHNPWEDFHIYAIEWFPDHIDFYYDDIKYFTFTNEGTGENEWPYFKPQYLILNAAIGGSWGGQQGIDNGIFPQQFIIDYVRVYQQKESGPYTLATAVNGNGLLHVSPALDTYPDQTMITLTADPDIGHTFTGWYGAQLPSTWVTTFIIDHDMDLTANFNQPGNMTGNSTFDKGRQGWYGPWPANGAEATVNADSGQMDVKITQAGLNAWDIQIINTSLYLQQGKHYRFEFDAKSTVDATFSAHVSKDESPWTSYLSIHASVSADWRHFESEFEMTQTNDYNVRVAFDLGKIEGTVSFDNMRFISLDERNLTPYALWKENHRIRPIQNGIDQDGDTIPAILEYAFGKDPDVAEPPLIIPSITANQLAINLPARDPQSSDVRVELQYSEDLETWEPTPDTTFDISSNDKFYLRLNAEEIPE